MVEGGHNHKHKEHQEGESNHDLLNRARLLPGSVSHPALQQRTVVLYEINPDRDHRKQEPQAEEPSLPEVNGASRDENEREQNENYHRLSDYSFGEWKHHDTQTVCAIDVNTLC